MHFSCIYCTKIPTVEFILFSYTLFLYFILYFDRNGNDRLYVVEIIASNVDVNARLEGQGTNWKTVHNDSLSFLSIFPDFSFFTRYLKRTASSFENTDARCFSITISSDTSCCCRRFRKHHGERSAQR